MNGVLTAVHLGPTSYREGLAIQEALVRLRADGRDAGDSHSVQPPTAAGVPGDWLLFPDHPPVLTMGRGGGEDSLRVDRPTLERLGVELFEVTRGGDVTWHGPGQLVGYTIVDLAARGRDLHRFLRDLEEALIQSLASWGIPAERVPGKTGVWSAGEKIASLGIAVRRWVGYHGFALNVAPDLKFFDLIHPCGLRGIHMTSAAARLGSLAPSLDRARLEVAGMLGKVLGYQEVRWAPAADVRSLAGVTAPVTGSSRNHAA